MSNNTLPVICPAITDAELSKQNVEWLRSRRSARKHETVKLTPRCQEKPLQEIGKMVLWELTVGIEGVWTPDSSDSPIGNRSYETQF